MLLHMNRGYARRRGPVSHKHRNAQTGEAAAEDVLQEEREHHTRCAGPFLGQPLRCTLQLSAGRTAELHRWLIYQRQPAVACLWAHQSACMPVTRNRSHLLRRLISRLLVVVEQIQEVYVFIIDVFHTLSLRPPSPLRRVRARCTTEKGLPHLSPAQTPHLQFKSTKSRSEGGGVVEAKFQKCRYVPASPRGSAPDLV